MRHACRVLFVGVMVVLACATAAPVQVVVAQSGRTPPALQAPSPEELKVYEAFRAWINTQAPEVRQEPDAAIWVRYARVLQSQGQSAQLAARTVEQLKTVGNRAEFERWNRILTAEKPSFNTAPNAFLVEMTKGLKPGRSLDVGMGQGRNTIYLAQQGWDSAGFDPADRAVAAAQDRAKALGVKITTTVTTDEAFEWGDSQWDLIVLSYVGAREYGDRVTRALRPLGMVVVEGFHRDATKSGPIGAAVVFDTNELVRLFPALRIVRYEDAPGTSDFGLVSTRVVRLAAIKP